MRKFVDLHIRPNLESINELEGMIKTASYLGFSALGIAIPLDKCNEIGSIKKICLSYGIDFVSRLDIVPRDRSSLSRDLEKFRSSFEIIGVNYVPSIVENDKRIDMIFFSGTIPPRAFFSKEARAAAESLISFEINLGNFIKLDGLNRAEYLSRLGIAVYFARKARMKIVVSSGAETKYLLRSPRDLAFLATSFNLEFKQAVKSVSDIPLGLINGNRLRSSSNYIEEGVKLVGET
jgi:RNase P/RNase MRP subunit p30